MDAAFIGNVEVTMAYRGKLSTLFDTIECAAEMQCFCCIVVIAVTKSHGCPKYKCF
jgi:hypothetical protein